MGADAAADDGNDGELHCRAGHDAQAVQVVGHRIGSDLEGTEAGNDADAEEPAQLEDAGFNAAGDADVENPADEGAVRSEGAAGQVDAQLWPEQQEESHEAGEGPSDEGGQRRTEDTPVQEVDGQGIAAEVDDVHHERQHHGRAGIPLGPEDGAERVVQSDEGIGQGRHDEIDQRIVKNTLLDAREAD